MKALLAGVALMAGLANATVIHWDYSNDSKFFFDKTAGDGIYTGAVTFVELNDGTLTLSDAAVGKYAIIDVTSNMFYISTSNVPGAIASNALFSGAFDFDINSASLGTSTGYTLTNLAVTNTVGSTALDEFAEAVNLYHDATYTFSLQGLGGNGQVATVPEPASLGLMGLGLLGLVAVARRKKLSA